eukprot:XP_011421516.1 PREDICTED: cell adhesion molecule 2 isoform X1 [Crassostrea gigas]
MDNIGLLFILLMILSAYNSSVGQYNLTGSLPAAILGKAYSWTCSIFTPVDQKYTVVKFTRNNILVGTVGWNSDGTCLSNPQSSRYELHCVSENVFSLSIPPASMTKYEESSDWRCGYFGDESYKSKVVQLKIAVFVRNLSLSPNKNPLTLAEGTRTLVTCSVNSDAYPAPIIQWFIGETEVNGTNQKLELIADKNDDAKILRCRATNNNNSLTTATVLNILYKPVTRIASPKVLNVNIGGKVKVNCEVVKSNPVVILEYLWSVPGNPEIVGRESYLSIDRVSLRGNNTLQCSARNSVGWSDAASVAINVLFMPLSPKFIKAICCYDHADIIWATSTSGSVEQTSFVQWASDAINGPFYNAATDAVNTTEEDVYSVRVNHLSPDSRYLFRVVSVNRYGSVSSTTVSCQIKKRGLAVALGVTFGVLLFLSVAANIYLIYRQSQTKDGNTTKSPRSKKDTNYEAESMKLSDVHQYQEITVS